MFTFVCNKPVWIEDEHSSWDRLGASCAKIMLHRGECNADPNRPALNRFIALLALTTICLSLLTFINVQRAKADEPTQQPAKQQPYGGCDEGWQAPRSIGARECRALGWVVRPRLVVDPHGLVVMSRLPHCTFEDASSGPIPCSYNFGRPTDGFGGGLAFWVTGTHAHNRTHYVWTTRPHNGWTWVSRSLADALAESGERGADTRNWEQCKSRQGTHLTVRCADGVYLRSS